MGHQKCSNVPDLIHHVHKYLNFYYHPKEDDNTEAAHSVYRHMGSFSSLSSKLISPVQFPTVSPPLVGTWSADTGLCRHCLSTQSMAPAIIRKKTKVLNSQRKMCVPCFVSVVNAMNTSFPASFYFTVNIGISGIEKAHILLLFHR